MFRIQSDWEIDLKNSGAFWISYHPSQNSKGAKGLISNCLENIQGEITVSNAEEKRNFKSKENFHVESYDEKVKWNTNLSSDIFLASSSVTRQGKKY
jgi:hypothetical protein